ncbi:MAG: hypothetical protein WCR19_03470 [Acholeplasmataceae bacterium]
MRKFNILLKGELQRLIKYKILPVSIFVALIWFLFLIFIENDEIFIAFLPMIIILDTTLMSILYTGATLFYEKSESTASTLLVTPTTHKSLILSKAFAGVIQTIFSTGLIILAFYLIKHIEIHLLSLFIVLIFSSLFHIFLGFIMTYITKDFTGLLVIAMIYSILLMIPTILNQIDILFKGDIWSYVLLLTPTKASIVVANVAFGMAIDAQYYISVFYLIVGSYLLFQFIVLPHFKSYVLKQGGI